MSSSNLRLISCMSLNTNNNDFVMSFFQKIVMCPNSPTMGVWLLIIGLGLTCVNLCDSHFVSNDLPCNFLDSINITDGVRQTNGSILFDGVLFEDDQYAKINYTLKNGSDKLPAEQHIRGCLCTYDRPCVRFCCTPEEAKDKTSDFCRLHETVKDFEGKILDENNQTKTVKLNDHFKYVDDFPCEYLYFADEYQITHVMNHIFAKIFNNQF